MDSGSWSHTHTWSSDPVHVGLARAFVTQHLADHGHLDLVESAELVVSELATNAVRHTGTPFTVTLRRHGSRVLLLVSDLSTVTPQVQVASTMPTSGMGLHVVDGISNAWGVLPEPAGGKSVWASFEVDVLS